MILWQNLASLGDQFLLIYSQSNVNIPAATLFNVGHAAELYLKALALKEDPNKPPSRYKHDLSELLDIAHSKGLLLDYKVNLKIRDNIMNKWPLPSDEAMKNPDFTTYIQHQELYWVVYYLADIKYLGSEHIRAPETFGVMVMVCNPYWISFFRQLRKYLNWPTVGGSFDYFKQNIDTNMIPAEANSFIKSLD